MSPQSIKQEPVEIDAWGLKARFYVNTKKRALVMAVFGLLSLGAVVDQYLIRQHQKLQDEKMADLQAKNAKCEERLDMLLPRQGQPWQPPMQSSAFELLDPLRQPAKQPSLQSADTLQERLEAAGQRRREPAR